MIRQIKEPDSDESRYLFLLLERGEVDLSDVIKNLQSKNRLTATKIRFYWEQMLEAVKDCHSKGVIHADVKPCNFVMVKGQLKIIDFGLAVQIEDGQESQTRSFVGGTKDFLSPEVYAAYVIEDGRLNLEKMKSSGIRPNLTTKVDVWALGIILYQWVYKENHPYSSLPGGKLTRIKALTTLDVPINLDPISDPLLWDTIRLCLEKPIENRPSIDQLLQHPYLNPVPLQI